MEAQEVFDKVATHLLTQNAKAKNGGSCRYLADDGKRCAVGCLLPVEVARRADELAADNTVYGVARDGLLPNELAPHVDLLSRLQGIHDHVDVHCWRDELKSLARELGFEHGAAQ